jgi:hypothetical protein
MHTTGYTGSAHYGGSFFTGAVEDGIEVSYSYSESNQTTDALEVGYSYGNTGDAGLTGLVYGSLNPYSQKIANNLPMWMDARKNRESIAQKLIGSWGSNIESVRSSYKEYRNNIFLTTANCYEDIWFGYSGLAFKGLRVYSPRFVNALYNSSFAFLGPKRYKSPDGWNVERDALSALVLSEDNAIFGSRSLFFDGSYGSASISQSSESNLNNGTLVFSTYIKAIDNTGTDFHDTDDAGLILTVKYIDEEIESIGVGFPKVADGNWSRISTKLPVKKEISSWQVVIRNRTNSQFYVDLPQLENNSFPTAWSPAANDIPPHLNGERTVTAVQVLFGGSEDHGKGDFVKKIEVLPATTEEAFRFPIIPTRVEKLSPKEFEGNSLNLTHSNRVNYYGENLALIWDVNESKLRQSALATPDVFESHFPADLVVLEDGKKQLDLRSVNSEDIAVKAVTIVGDLFYVITKEDYAGSSGYYLKMVEPRKKAESDTYLPSLGDIELPLELGGANFGEDGVSEDVIRLGIAKNLADVIFVDTDLDRRFYFKLRYDYYYADFGKRKLFCRENYTKTMGHLQVI